jgi:hypothetical protein
LRYLHGVLPPLTPRNALKLSPFSSDVAPAMPGLDSIGRGTTQ